MLLLSPHLCLIALEPSILLCLYNRSPTISESIIHAYKSKTMFPSNKTCHMHFLVTHSFSFSLRWPWSLIFFATEFRAVGVELGILGVLKVCVLLGTLL